MTLKSSNSWNWQLRVTALLRWDVYCDVTGGTWLATALAEYGNSIFMQKSFAGYTPFFLCHLWNSRNITPAPIAVDFKSNNKFTKWLAPGKRMKCSFPLLVLCINCALLSLLVGRSDGGVGSLCEDGKFFDRSRQQFVPCGECKNENQGCFSCCKTNPDAQGTSLKFFFLIMTFG